jgi:hypothetical protein
LCLLLSERGEQVDWGALSPDQWRTLGVLALEHGVAPLAYRCFETQGWPVGSPSGFQQALLDASYQSAAHNATLYHELDQILDALYQAEISVILLKGAHLAAALYADIALRPMHDLDLLVHEADLERARMALAGFGYSRPYPVISQGLNRELGHHIYLSRENTSPPGLELHWSLVGGKADRRSAPAGWFWEHTQPLQPSVLPSGASHNALVLNPSANLLFLAAHLYLKHYGDSGRLIWLVDVHLLLESWGQAVDWGAVIGAAAQTGWTEALYGALRAAQEDLGSQLPEGILPTLAASLPDQAVGPRRRDAQPRYHARATLDTLANYRPAARLPVLLAMLFPSPAHMRWRYRPHPSWLWPLYYPVKWAGMLRDGLRILWEGAAGGSL